MNMKTSTKTSMKCISIPNPVSYLVCYGIKDVENRNWQTDYRGRLYIHSGGLIAIRGMPDMSRFPLPLINEFDATMSKIEQLAGKNKYVGINDRGVSIYLKQKKRMSAGEMAQYRLLEDVYSSYHTTRKEVFFHVNAIIGHVDLVDISYAAGGVWAESGKYHWILRNPTLLEQPIPDVAERGGLWNHTDRGAV